MAVEIRVAATKESSTLGAGPPAPGLIVVDEPPVTDPIETTPDALRALIGKRFYITMSGDDDALVEASAQLKALLAPARPPPPTSRTARWLAKLRGPSTRADVERATSALDIVGDIVPPSIADGEIGDALERVEQLHRSGASCGRIRLVVWRTIVWSAVNAIRELVRAFLGKPKKKGAE